MRKIFYFIILLIFATSCSNELGRGEAENKIEEFFEYPNVEITQFPGVTSSEKLNNEYRDLRGRNFIKEKRKGKWGNEFWVIMKKKGNGFVHSGEASYSGYQVASSILELSEVTGIRLDDGKNTAVVDYNLKRTKVTLFGNSKGFFDGDIIEKQTVFQLYDDGWRITDKKPKVTKEEKFSGFDQKFMEEIEKKEKEIQIAKNTILVFEGQIKNYPIIMELTFYQDEEEYDCNRGGSIVEGNYYYKKSGPANKLKLKGYTCGASINLTEVDKDDNWTGDFGGIMNGGDINGSWSNEKTRLDWNVKQTDTKNK